MSQTEFFSGEKSCATCGQPIPVERQNAKSKYCSRSCRATHQSREKKRAYNTALRARTEKKLEALRTKRCTACSGPIPDARLLAGCEQCSQACRGKARRDAELSALHANPRACWCGKTIPPEVLLDAPMRKFCSVECRTAAQRERGIQKPHRARVDPHGGTSRVGAQAELAAAADLLTRGFWVYRAVSPDAPFDLVAVGEDGLPLRVEVRASSQGSRRVLGKKKETDLCDLYAFVAAEKIEYEESYNHEQETPEGER